MGLLDAYNQPTSSTFVSSKASCDGAVKEPQRSDGAP